MTSVSLMSLDSKHLCEVVNGSLFYFHCVAAVELEIDLSSEGLTMVVPWSLPKDLLDDVSEPRAKMGKIYEDKVGTCSSSWQIPHAVFKISELVFV